VERYLNDHLLMATDRRSGQPALVGSAVPLLNPDRLGGTSVTDPSLELRGYGYSTVNNLQEVSIPIRPADGIEFEGTGIRLAPLADEGSRATVVDDGRVTYTNIEPDTDLSISPMPGGIQTHHVLRSPLAPERLGLNMVLPAGAVILPDQLGGALIVVGGSTVGTISSPAAVDSAGREVPARLEVDGAHVTLVLEHRREAVVYPILLDPVWDTNPRPTSGASAFAFQGWRLDTWWPGSYTSAVGAGGEKYIWGLPGQYPSITWAQWSYNVPHIFAGGQGFVYATDFNGVQSQADGTCLTLGHRELGGDTWYRVFEPSGTWVYCGSIWGGNVQACVQADCSPNAPARTQAGIQHWRYPGTQNGYSYAMVANTTVYMSDNDAPEWRDLGGWVGGGGWTNTSQQQETFVAHAKDPGLGLSETGVTYAGQFIPGGWSFSACDGSTYGFGENTCQQEMRVTPTATLLEGEHDASYWAQDVLGRRITSTRTIRLDRGAPEIRFGGSLGARSANAETDPLVRAIADPAKMTIDVTDGATTNSWTKRSGVKTVSFALQRKVNGSWVAVSDSNLTTYSGPSCSATSCPMPTKSWTLDPQVREPGIYRLRVQATDFAGNVGPEVYRYMKVASGEITTFVEGQRVSRYVGLAGKVAGYTDVTWEYRKLGQSAWTAIPTTALKQSNLQPVGAWPVPLSEPVAWDLAKDATAAGIETYKAFDVRGRVANGATTDELRLEYDPSGNGSTNDRKTVGPGSVDLQTGSFAVQETDVSVSAPLADLELTRTYNSRGRPSQQPGPLGDGWNISIPSIEGSDYIKVVFEPATEEYFVYDGEVETVVEPGYAVLTSGDGSEVVFEQNLAEDPSKPAFVGEAGLEHLSLKPIGSVRQPTGFELTDNESSERFEFQQSTDAKVFEIATVRSLGSNTKAMSYAWKVLGGKRQLIRVTAPAAPTLGSCDAPSTGNPPVGCRWLDLLYNGDGRLSEVKFGAHGPTGVESLKTMARYEYQGGRLSAVYDEADLKTSYAYEPIAAGGGRPAATLLKTVTPPGAERPWTINYQPVSTDKEFGRFASVARDALPSGVATTKLAYEVPRSNVSPATGPWDMNPGTLGLLGQASIPIDGTALFAPDVSASTDAKQAVVHYLDTNGRAVNVVAPGADPTKPRITTAEYDKFGNVTRSLSAQNRADAIATGLTGDPLKAKARALSTERKYTSTDAGSRLLWELGPQRIVRIGNSSTAARPHTVVQYDEGRPANDQTNYNLPTTTTVAAFTGTPNYDDSSLATLGANDVDRRTTKSVYNFAERLPLETIVDPGGLNLRTVTQYNAQGLVTEERTPRSEGGGDASARKTIYYTADATSGQAECNDKPYWAGFICQHRPAAQPGTAGLPELPVTTYQYSSLGNVTVETDEVGGSPSASRTTTTAYDGFGRVSKITTTGSGTGAGMAMDAVETVYDPATGRVTATRNLNGATVTGQVTKKYDALGRLYEYKDAEGLVSTTTFDILDRPTQVVDAKQGTRTWTYDVRTGDAASMVDPALGAASGQPSVTAEYDADGKLVAQTFTKSGVRTEIGYDASGQVASRRYKRTAGCTTACDLSSTSVARSIHGRVATQDTARSGWTQSEEFTYDQAGRVTQASDRVNGQCTVRTYEFAGVRGKNSNRTSTTTRNPGAGGACATSGGAATPLNHDVADRITDSGFTYDPFGRITKVPAAHAGGHELTASYYVSDLARTMTQAGTTSTITLDPLDRVRRRVATGGEAFTEISYYDQDGDEPALTQRGSTVFREVEGLDGELAATTGTSQGTVLQLTDVHGDVVGELPNSATASTLSATKSQDEFGVPGAGSATLPKAISRVSSASARLTTAGTSLTINKPASVVQGDLLLAGITTPNGVSISPPSGWAAVPGAAVTSGASSIQVFSYRLGASEPASYAFTIGAAGKHAGSITALRNTSSSAAIGPVAVAASAGTNVTAPAVVPSTNNAAVQVFVGSSSGDVDGGAAWAFTSPFTHSSSTSTGTAATSVDRNIGLGVRVLSGGAGVSTGTTLVTNQTAVTTSVANGAITMAVSPETTAAAAHYGWLGGKQRHTSTKTGAIEMGARIYVPQLGRFLQPDPVYGGSANSYDYANQDPVNNYDLAGTCTGPAFMVCVSMGARAVQALRAGAAEAGRRAALRKALTGVVVRAETKRAAASLVKAWVGAARWAKAVKLATVVKATIKLGKAYSKWEKFQDKYPKTAILVKDAVKRIAKKWARSYD
jgi:RHS repeat-associated protein